MKIIILDKYGVANSLMAFKNLYVLPTLILGTCMYDAQSSLSTFKTVTAVLVVNLFYELVLIIQ